MSRFQLEIPAPLSDLSFPIFHTAPPGTRSMLFVVQQLASAAPSRRREVALRGITRDYLRHPNQTPSGLSAPSAMKIT